MQNIKRLKSKSQEGLEVRNYQTFPSMEWGENGGLQADLYFNNKFLARVYNEGNGGCAIAYMQTKNETEWNEFKQACFDFLLRNDKDFGPNSQYEWMRKKTPERIDDDDLELVVNLLYKRHLHIKEAEKALKNNYGKIVVCNKGYQFKYYMCSFLMTDDKFKEVCKNKEDTQDFKIYSLKELQQAF